MDESGHGSVASLSPRSVVTEWLYVTDRMKNGTIAKLALKVSGYYEESLRLSVAAKGAGGVWPLFSFPQVSLTNARKEKG